MNLEELWEILIAVSAGAFVLTAIALVLSLLEGNI